LFRDWEGEEEEEEVALQEEVEVEVVVVEDRVLCSLEMVSWEVLLQKLHDRYPNM
jgi:hypothetical protein